MFITKKVSTLALTIVFILLSLTQWLTSVSAEEKAVDVKVPNGSESTTYFTPPNEEDIPDSLFGEAVRYGKSLFDNTQQLRGKYVGNELNCVNCHLDSGRKANSAPLWAAYPMFPAYRNKNNRVNTIEDRIQGCFTYSMNGTPPPAGSKELTSLLSYHFWLSTGAPVGKAQPGRGYPKLAKTETEPSLSRGKNVYTENCAICHGENGEGAIEDGKYVFPALWGKDSFNWGAGMHRVDMASNFIKANMPLGKPYSLTDQQTWDVAAFMNSHERPQDPRHKGDLDHAAETFHKHQCFYGKKVEDKLIGE